MKGLALSLTRRYRFSASHRLHSCELSEAENSRIYGKCNNPFGHGHDYVLEVTVRGEADGETGVLVPLKVLDDLVESQVVSVFHNRNINLDVPQFMKLVPTTENVAVVIAELLEAKWRNALLGSRARLDRIHIQETDRNGFEVLMGEVTDRKPEVQLSEVHA